jgi:hypothetical protein
MTRRYRACHEHSLGFQSYVYASINESRHRLSLGGPRANCVDLDLKHTPESFHTIATKRDQ